jgi:phage-related protein
MILRARVEWIAVAVVAASALSVSHERGALRASIGAEASALFIKPPRIDLGRAFRDVGRAFGNAFRHVRRGFDTAVRNVGRTISNVGRGIHRFVQGASRTVGHGLQQLGRGVGQLVQNAGRSIQTFMRNAGRVAKQGWDGFTRGVSNLAKGAMKGLQQFGKWVGTNAKKAADWVKQNLKIDIKDLFCKTIGIAICPIIDIVQAAGKFIGKVTRHGLPKAIQMTFEELINDFKNKVNRVTRQLEDVFKSFRSVLSMKEYRFEKIMDFTKTVVVAVKNVHDELPNPLPSPFKDVNGWILGGSIGLSLAPAVAGIAAAHFGVRKLMEFAVPKLILGAGAAFKFVNDKLPEGFDKFVSGLLKVAGAGAGAILPNLIKNPRTKARLKAAFLQAANIAGKIEKALDSGLKVAEAMRRGSFESMELALAQGQTLTAGQLTREDIGNLIDGLGDFLKDQIVVAIEDPIRKLLSKALSMLNRLLDIPRTALVSGVGTIPFVGGVIAGALNFGIGMVVEMINNFLIEQVMELVRGIVSDSVDSMRDVLKAELTRTRSNREAASGFAGLLQVVKQLAGDVSRSLKTAASGARGSLVALAGTAVQELVLRGIADGDLRRIISSALEGLAGELGKPGVTFAKVLSSLLRSVAGPIADLVGKRAPAPIRGALSAAVRAVLGGQVNIARIKALASNPKGFLSGLANDLLKGGPVRSALIGYLKQAVPGVANAPIVQKVAGLAARVGREGFGALMHMTEELGDIVASLRGVAGAPAGATSGTQPQGRGEPDGQGGPDGVPDRQEPEGQGQPAGQGEPEGQRQPDGQGQPDGQTEE